jgi:hypothetical protein
MAIHHIPDRVIVLSGMHRLCKRVEFLAKKVGGTITSLPYLPERSAAMHPVGLTRVNPQVDQR